MSGRHISTIATVLLVYAITVACSDKVTLWPAIAITSQPSDISQGSVVLHGEVVIDKYSNAGFEFGTSTEYGQRIYDIQYDTQTNSKIEISYFLGTLIPNTTYHYRSVAESKNGIIYGDDVSFTTMDNKIVFNPNLTYGSVSDVDGNTYKTIKIGSQTWMAENLRTSRYNDGSPITFIGPADKWFVTGQAEYCWYNDDKTRFGDTYGAIYNWYAVNSYKLCPAGWHVPEDSEWKILIDYLGGPLDIGIKIKETGGIHWLNPDSKTTNESGFTALPSGYRNFDGSYKVQPPLSSWKGTEAYWWTSTQAYYQGSFYMAMYAGSNALLKGSWRFEMGHSVRCVMNVE